jgi:hypothetical protein
MVCELILLNVKEGARPRTCSKYAAYPLLSASIYTRSYCPSPPSASSVASVSAAGPARQSTRAATPAASRYPRATCSDAKEANREIRFGTARHRNGTLNDGRIQNPSDAFGIVPLCNFVPRVLELSIIQ